MGVLGRTHKRKSIEDVTGRNTEDSYPYYSGSPGSDAELCSRVDAIEAESGRPHVSCLEDRQKRPYRRL